MAGPKQVVRPPRYEVVAIDPDQQLVFDRIYASRHATGDWPRLEQLQRQLASERHDAKVRALVMRSAEYVGLVSPDEELRLLLRGLAEVAEARPLLDAYLLALHSIVARYREPQFEARYSSEDVSALGIEPALERELGELLRDDGWAFGSGGGTGDEWSFEISDRVLAATDATSVEDLLAVRFGEQPERDDEAEGPAPEPLATSRGTAPTVDADRPITAIEQDLLDRVPLARVLATQATAQIGDGFVMGVAGPWGSGKTSLLNLMVAEIDRAGTGHIVRFDPWLFSSSEELVLRFLREVQAQLGRSGRLGEAAARIGEYAQILAPVTVIAGAPWLAAPLSISGRIARRRANKQAAISAQQQREKVAEVLRSLDRRLVVVIDDLDRLAPDEVRDVVRLVKLVGDFPNTTYVLAYDQMRVALALGDDEQEGQEFLEKIVQLTHEVPPVSEAQLARTLGTSISAAVGDLSRYQFDEGEYASLFAHARELFASVRDIRRFTNVLPGTLALTKEEVELADVLALEALRVRVPSSFALILSARRALTRTRGEGLRTAAEDEADQHQVGAVVHAGGRHEQAVSAIVRRLFPGAAQHLGGTHYGSEWLGKWRQARRVAHPEVLDIYFGKTLPPGVVPVSLVESAFESLEDRDALTTLLAGLDDDRLELLLGRLEQYEDRFPTAHPEIAISILYNEQHRLQRPRRHVFDLGAGYEVPRIVLRLLRKLDQATVARVVDSAVPDIETLSSRGDLVRSVGYRENSGHQLVNEEDARRLEAAFLDELLDATGPRLADEHDLLPLLFWAHGERPKVTLARVEQLVAEDGFLLALLTAAVREVVGQTFGEMAVRRSQQLEWEALTTLIPGTLLGERLAQLGAPEILDQLDGSTKLAVELALKHVDETRQPLASATARDATDESSTATIP